MLQGFMTMYTNNSDSINSNHYSYFQGGGNTEKAPGVHRLRRYEVDFFHPLAVSSHIRMKDYHMVVFRKDKIQVPDTGVHWTVE